VEEKLEFIIGLEDQVKSQGLYIYRGTYGLVSIEELQAAGAEIMLVKSDKGRVDLRDLMRKLGRMDILSVLVEGGAEIQASALKSGIVDKVVLYIAPTLMTGSDSLCSIGGVSPIKLGHAVRLKDVTSRFVGQDIMVVGYIRQ
jgi:diaminohydroxyphosphoribosylaminopyrimidine deaminase/5-amino-6-(5-phosphoribosylamino)uracil reductase